MGVDIAQNSLRHLVSERIPSLYRADPTAPRRVERLICADLCEDDLASSILSTHEWSLEQSGRGKQGLPQSMWSDKVPLTPEDLFDIVSAQFSIHYMFRSEQTVRHFLKQVSKII